MKIAIVINMLAISIAHCVGSTSKSCLKRKTRTEVKNKSQIIALKFLAWYSMQFGIAGTEEHT